MDSIEQWCSDHRLTLSQDSLGSIRRWWDTTRAYGMGDVLFQQLARFLADFPDLENGLEKLFRFVDRTRSPRFFLSFLDRDPDALPVLLRILSIPSSATEWLIHDPDSFDWLRLHAGQSTKAELLRDVLVNELLGLEEERDWLPCMRTFRQRETLRVVCGFYLHGVSAEESMRQLADIADAGVHGCLKVVEISSQSRRKQSTPLSNLVSFLAVGDYGTGMLDFVQPLELQVLLNRTAAPSVSPPACSDEELSRFVSRWSYWMTHPSGLAYSLDTTGLLPIPTSIAPCNLLDPKAWIQEIDREGFAVGRFALLSPRFIAGDPFTASQAIEESSSFVFQQFSSEEDEAEFIAVDRQNLRRPKQSYHFTSGPALSSAPAPSSHLLNLWSALGDLRLQQCWHQLQDSLNGNKAIDISVDVSEQNGNRDAGISKLRGEVLRCQIEEVDFSTFGVRNVSVGDSKAPPEKECLRWGQSNEWDEVDLILDPKPSEEWCYEVLSRFGFKHRTTALQHLRALAREDIRLLSTKRCRFALSKIARTLLQKIHATPDPDLTLENLCATTRSIGGKGILWELFHFHEASMELYVRLCGASPYLVSILLQHPGMIDELLDSLMLSKLPTATQLTSVLSEMCRGADEIHPILVSFKNAMHLNVGIRDLLGKDDIATTHRVLSAIADTCVERLIQSVYDALKRKQGTPLLPSGDECPFVFLTLGKYGAQEPNYHSDLSLICFYASDGNVIPSAASSTSRPVSHFDFFSQLAIKVNQQLQKLGPTGRLYESHLYSLAPKDRSPMAWSLERFENFIERQPLNSIQRVQLSPARCLNSESPFGRKVLKALHDAITSAPWGSDESRLVVEERLRLEQTASSRNIKRGRGGTLDVEWLAQCKLLQRLSSHALSGERSFSTSEILQALADAGDLSVRESSDLKASYQFLRTIETGLRLMNLSARHDLPTDREALDRLAYVLHMADGVEIESHCAQHRDRIRELFLKHCV